MSKQTLLDKWRSGTCKDFRIAEVEKELKRLGFEVWQAKKHWKAKHPILAGHPDFGMRTLTINAHAYGNPGEVHPDAIRDIVKAVKWIDENGNT